ncbi:MAG: N-acetylmuramoyl-L-alanine amidase [Xanthomonadales bacterium]|nr:N-acetylmuramoyl-L-alanine amidase [Xanthomonadales bacterium]
MGKRLFKWGSTGLLLLLAAAALAAPKNSEINGFRVWTDPEKTRVVFDLSSDATYKLFELDDPVRVVLDLQATELKTTLKLDPKTAGILEAVRFGNPAGGKMRVVLDLAAKVDPRSFLLAPIGEYGHRLVVDLYPHKRGIRSTQVKAIKRLQPSLERNVVIAVDAGHGGEDPGAIGASKSREKDITLQISRAVKKAIDARPGMEAVLIRDGDYYIPLRQRFAKARTARADMFISIHADAFRKRSVSGSSVFVLSRRGASSEAARWLANAENQADLIGGVTLEDKDNVLASVLLDLSQNAAMESSAHAANQVFQSLRKLGKTHKKAVEHAAFVVLKSPDVPSMLIETGYITNPSEEKKLKNRKHQNKLAMAIADGVEQHFRQQSLPGTWIAANRKVSRHIVARGDTLGGIAQRYNISLSSLRQVNRLKSDRLSIGKELVIPAG